MYDINARFAYLQLLPDRYLISRLVKIKSMYKYLFESQQTVKYQFKPAFYERVLHNF